LAARTARDQSIDPMVISRVSGEADDGLAQGFDRTGCDLVLVRFLDFMSLAWRKQEVKY
jgi:hypothetical protein